MLLLKLIGTQQVRNGRHKEEAAPAALWKKRDEWTEVKLSKWSVKKLNRSASMHATPSPPSPPPTPPPPAAAASPVKCHKKVRFLEDVTGNLHTSVLGGSAESLGSMLDLHRDLYHHEEHSPRAQRAAWLRTPAQAPAHRDEETVEEMIDRVESFMEAFSGGGGGGDGVNEQNQLKSPPELVQRPAAVPAAPVGDLFAEVSDLLERSLLEIRRMEEESMKCAAVVEPESPPELELSKREPLYELVGRRRNSTLTPLTAAPMEARRHERPHQDPVWLRRAAGAEEDDSIYGRIWESSSPVSNVSSNSSSSSEAADSGPSPVQKQATANDLTAIRSMARKARLEHWRLAGIEPAHASKSAQVVTPSSDVVMLHDDGASASATCAATDASTPAFLSSLPLVQIPKMGLQLTWPPPPVPPSPALTSSPVSPTSPCGFKSAAEALRSNNNRDSTNGAPFFQWPAPATNTKFSNNNNHRASSSRTTVINGKQDSFFL